MGHIKIIPVTSGRFYCESCGLPFLGTYHGDFSKAPCPFCDGPITKVKNGTDE